MAMLAERRVRRKWSLNPRGTLWVNDEEKFGQKLLEKMGWSSGKGLGKELQGDKDHILLHMKNSKQDSKGIGFKGRDDEWIKNYEGFENVLAALNSEHKSAVTSPCGSALNSNVNSDEEDSKPISLEAHSKKSHARVHYHKFTRGKDLSHYDADTIACITGSKRSKILAEAKKDEAEEGEDEVGSKQHFSGVTTIKGENIQEYFAKKMAKLKGSLSQQVSNKEDDADSKNDDREYGEIEDGYRGFEQMQDGYHSEDKRSEDDIKVENTEMYDQEEKDVLESEGKIKKKKKSKKSKIVMEEVLDSVESNNEMIQDENCGERKKKRKKKVGETPDIDKDEKDCTAEGDLNEPQKKKKKKVTDVPEDGDYQEQNDDNTGKVSKKKKKKNRKEENKEQEKVDDLQNENGDSIEEPRKTKKKLKKI